MARIFDNGKHWFKLAELQGETVLFVANAPKAPMTAPGKKDWKALYIQRSTLDKKLVHQLNAFFGTNFRPKQLSASPTEFLYLGVFRYRVIAVGGDEVLQRSDANSMPPPEDGKRARTLEYGRFDVDAVVSAWEVVYEKGHFVVPLPADDREAINLHFQTSF